jgi:pimeloyl-ACP methyl ester carboxylesterase
MAATSSTPRPLERVSAYGPQDRSAWLDIDWREHQRWVTVAGRPVNVIEIGEGPPMVFIHGLSGSWQNWLENLPHFAQTHRCIAMDLPGFGYSPMPVEKITITNYGRIVDELLGALDVERAVIVGNSMGGFIANEIALQFSTRVEKLVLISAVGLSIEHMRNDRLFAGLERADELFLFWGAFLAGRSDRLTRRPRLRRALMNIAFAHPDRLPAPLMAEQLKGQGKPGFIPALGALLTYPIRDRLNEIESPTLIVWGDKDRLVPVKDAWDFHELIPDSRVIVYEDTGHVAMIERPAAFNAAVDEFLEE